jgi:hypothetical protein
MLILAWALVCAGPDAGAFEWQVLRPLGEVEVPGELQAQRVPVRLKAVVSAAPPAAILSDFEQQFRRAGFFVAPSRERVDLLQPQLTGLDTARKVSYSVIVLPNRDGTVTVVMGEADHARLAAPEGAEGLAPMLPDAAEVMVSRQEGARMVSYLTARSEEEVGAFYRSVLVHDGYREVARGRFRKGSAELRVSSEGRRSGRSAVVILERAVEEEGSAPSK